MSPVGCGTRPITALHHACLTLPISPAPPASSLLRGSRGAEAELQYGGRHLELRRHPVHPAQRRAALLGRDGEADLQGHPGGGAGWGWGQEVCAAWHSVSAAASSGAANGDAPELSWPLPLPALTHHLCPGIAACRATWTSRATPGPRCVSAAERTSSMCFLRTEPLSTSLTSLTSPTLPLPHLPLPQISDEAKDCVRRMLEPNPAKRATAQEILQVGGAGRRGRLGWWVGEKKCQEHSCYAASEGCCARLALELTAPTAAVDLSRCHSMSGCARTAWPPISRWTMLS